MHEICNGLHSHDSLARFQMASSVVARLLIMFDTYIMLVEQRMIMRFLLRSTILPVRHPLRYHVCAPIGQLEIPNTAVFITLYLGLYIARSKAMTCGEAASHADL